MTAAVSSGTGNCGGWGSRGETEDHGQSSRKQQCEGQQGQHAGHGRRRRRGSLPGCSCYIAGPPPQAAPVTPGVGPTKLLDAGGTVDTTTYWTRSKLAAVAEAAQTDGSVQENNKTPGLSRRLPAMTLLPAGVLHQCGRLRRSFVAWAAVGGWLRSRAESLSPVPGWRWGVYLRGWADVEVYLHTTPIIFTTKWLQNDLIGFYPVEFREVWLWGTVWDWLVLVLSLIKYLKLDICNKTFTLFLAMTMMMKM